MKDYYEILGVSPEAEVEVITAAYKALMRKYHPDTNNSADAEAKAKKINEAYETLKDPALRASYDLGHKKTSGRGSAPPPPPPPPNPEAQAVGEPSGNIFVTSSGALRVWLIFAVSFVGAALLFDFVGSDPLWFADALGVALIPFGIAYAGARLWKALSAQDTEQKTHRLRWFWLQIPVLALMIYGQSVGAPDDPVAAQNAALVDDEPDRIEAQSSTEFLGNQCVASISEEGWMNATNVCLTMARQGDTWSQWQVGVMYQKGAFGEVDNQKAVFWYRTAAEQGSAAGQWNLGAMYRYGLGVSQDPILAVHWYREAANQGDRAGQYFLAEMYELGEGVPRNLAKAEFWYRMAADQGHEEAQARLTERF